MSVSLSLAITSAFKIETRGLRIDTLPSSGTTSSTSWWLSIVTAYRVLCLIRSQRPLASGFKIWVFPSRSVVLFRAFGGFGGVPPCHWLFASNRFAEFNAGAPRTILS